MMLIDMGRPPTHCIKQRRVQCINLFFLCIILCSLFKSFSVYIHKEESFLLPYCSSCSFERLHTCGRLLSISKKCEGIAMHIYSSLFRCSIKETNDYMWWQSKHLSLFRQTSLWPKDNDVQLIWPSLSYFLIGNKEFY